MVAISAFTLTLIAVAIVIYCEYRHYQTVPETADTLSAAEQAELDIQLCSEQRYEHRLPRENAVGFIDKFKAVIQFIHFIFFMSPEAKKLLIQRNEQTAEKLLKEYQSFMVAPADERVGRFLQWQDDLAHFEENKSALHSVKSDVVEFRFR